MNPIELGSLLLAIAVVPQTIELLQTRDSWGDDGIWRWKTLRRDFSGFPFPLPAIFDALLCRRGFFVVLGLRLLAALLILAGVLHSALLGVLFVTTWLISVRWRGTYNGGSDSMTAITALGLWIAALFADRPPLARGALAFIAIQLTASYFIAGVVKIRNPLWRNGAALPEFFRTPGYDSPPAWLRSALDRPGVARLAAWSVIALELAFPLAWTSPGAALGLMTAALAFHVFNFWALGLNRFIFAWLAAYPALYAWALYRSP